MSLEKNKKIKVSSERLKDVKYDKIYLHINQLGTHI